MTKLHTGMKVKVVRLSELDMSSLEEEYKPYHLHDKDWKNAAQAHISRRTTGVRGTLVSHLAGSDQRIWWVRHENGEYSVYRAEELELLT